MTEATFKPGDRVRIGAEWQREGIVVGYAPIDGMVVVQHCIHDPVVGRHHAADLTLIPDTVTVPVEVTRDELERVCEAWSREVCERALAQAVAHSWSVAALDWRFRLACHDARDRESNR